MRRLLFLEADHAEGNNVLLGWYLGLWLVWRGRLPGRTSKAFGTMMTE